MPDHPLDSIGLPVAILRAVRSLGVTSREGLRSMIEAAPGDLARFLGADSYRIVLHALGDRSNDGLRSPGFEPDPVLLGARLDTSPQAATSGVDLALRDRLFDELRQLRRNPDSHRGRIQELEDRLNAMLDEGEARTLANE